MAFEDNLPRKFCCECTLKTGGKIIIGLQIAVWCLLIIVLIAILITAALTHADVSILHHELCGSDLTKIVLLFFILIVFISIRLVISGLALHGILNDKTNLIMPWLIFEVLTIIATFIYNLSQGIILILDEKTRPIGKGHLVAGFIVALVSVYFWMVMCALYLQLE